MKKVYLIYIILLMLMLFGGCEQHQSNLGGVIPEPLMIAFGGDNYNADKNLIVYADSRFANIAKSSINQRFDVEVVSTEIKEDADLCFIFDKSIAEEGYELDVSNDGVEIVASTPKGCFYAIQTLKQLNGTSNQLQFPHVKIVDEPQFEYRGLMLDVSRYFIPKQTILKIIDAASMMKINKFHFHFVDDNGWRLEIKRYPKLTEVGAWRVERDEPFPMRPNTKRGEPTPVGGFYTQEDIREIVAYALQRQINIIPEIEMPAHANSSLAAYPELACSMVDEYIGMPPGCANTELIYCAGNEKVFDFLENVIDEIVELFPYEYIHLGGDEVVKTHWKRCPDCQARVKNEGLSCEEELQSYFMKRMWKYVESKGRKIMGWDELTNGVLPENVVILDWRGDVSTAPKAAKLGHEFIMTPAETLYFIRYQGPQSFESVTYFGNNTLKNIYDYAPIGMDWSEGAKKLCKGVQGSLWTEFCNTSEDVKYLILPRLATLAEIAWTDNRVKNWNEFLEHLDDHLKFWDEMEINYAR